MQSGLVLPWCCPHFFGKIFTLYHIVLNCTTLCHTVLTLFWGNCYFVVEKLEYLVAPTFGPGAALVLSTVHTLGELCHTTVPHYCTTLVLSTLWGLLFQPPLKLHRHHLPTNRITSRKMANLKLFELQNACIAMQWLTMEYANTPIHLKTCHPSWHFHSPTKFHFKM